LVDAHLRFVLILATVLCISASSAPAETNAASAFPVLKPTGQPTRPPSAATPEPMPPTAADKRGTADRLPAPGARFRDCAQCPEMVVVPAGTFMMGSAGGEDGHEPDEAPRHEVRLAAPVAVGRGAVTVAQFRSFVLATRHAVITGCRVAIADAWHVQTDAQFGNPGIEQQPDHPAVCVSWHDARAYADWLSRETGRRYRLPSEAEREYFTRAGTRSVFWWGDVISEQRANYDATLTFLGSPRGAWRRTTLPALALPANPWGLSQVHGNVAEWVEDCWNASYAGAPADGSAWTTGDCALRVLRGGSWGYPPKDLRAAYREAVAADQRYFHVGFRVVTSGEAR
jgi:formylglycine-generating enzyme required for sulfatase activity